MKTRHFILGFLAIFTLAWVIDAFWISPITGDTPWVIRKNAIYITGILAMALMSLAMVLALRPVWLEKYFNGLDKIYHIHKWTGILAILFALSHWLIKLSGSQLAALYGTTGKPARDPVLFFMTAMRGIGKDLGEWSIYLLLGLLVIALLKKIPYEPWRLLHKAMPIIYLALVVHTLALTPLSYWAGTSSILLIGMLIAGTYSAIYVLAQMIGKKRKHTAIVKDIEIINDNVLELSCEIDKKWPKHNAGQFAFIRFEPNACAHPFTIASSYNSKTNTLDFKIKSLGDYTNKLKDELQIGQVIEIEGPYGRFNYCLGKNHQIWVAAGIGITPFLAWLEDMQNKPSNIHVDMHYCVRNAEGDDLVAYVKNLCRNLPNVNLYIYDETAKQRLSAEIITDLASTNDKQLDVWFCGPNKFAKSLSSGLQKINTHQSNFHQEVFNMR